MSVGDLDRNLRLCRIRMFGDIAQRFLRNAEEDERAFAIHDPFGGERRELRIDLDAGHALVVFGELSKRGNEAALVDDCRVETMGDAPEHDAEVLELTAECLRSRLLAVGAGAIVGGRPLLDVVLEEGDALQGVVMDLAGDVGALFFVRGNELLGVLAVEGEEPPLVDEQRGAQRG